MSTPTTPELAPVDDVLRTALTSGTRPGRPGPQVFSSSLVMVTAFLAVELVAVVLARVAQLGHGEVEAVDLDSVDDDAHLRLGRWNGREIQPAHAKQRLSG